MKKTISVVMAVVLALCASVIAFAVTENTVLADENVISNGTLVYETNETKSSGALNYGGTFGFCEEKGKAYIIKGDICTLCKSEECHEEVTIFYAVKCGKCGTINCAYNVNDFIASYAASLNIVSPDGSKVNECKVCGHLFGETDLFNKNTVTEMNAEGSKVDMVTYYRNKYFRVYDCNEETMEKLGKVDGDLSLSDYQEKATSSKILGIIALPFLKMFGVMTFDKGYILDIILYFAKDLIARIVS